MLLTEIIIKSADIECARRNRDRRHRLHPVGIALARATNSPWKISRSGGFSKKYGRLEFPPELTRYVDCYDNGQEVLPQRFSLNVVLEEKETCA